MKRTQVQLTEEQVEYLDDLARERGVSRAEVVREALEFKRKQVARTEDRWENVFELSGKFSSGKKNISEEHDRELAEIYSQ